MQTEYWAEKRRSRRRKGGVGLVVGGTVFPYISRN
jgi:hypothetical protein